MTRQEAKEIMQKHLNAFEGGASIYQALQMATDALDDIDRVLEIIDQELENPHLFAWAYQEKLKYAIAAMKEGKTE